MAPPAGAWEWVRFPRTIFSFPSRQFCRLGLSMSIHLGTVSVILGTRNANEWRSKCSNINEKRENHRHVAAMGPLRRVAARALLIDDCLTVHQQRQ